MAIQTDIPESPGWWLQKLWEKLNTRRKDIQDLFDRYGGDAPIPASLKDAPEAAQQFFQTSRTRFAEMIVKAVRYPLQIQAITTGETQGASGDSTAWNIFRSSGMQEESPAVHTTSLVSGWSYAIISKHPIYGPRYTAEDPREVVTIQDPMVQAETRAGMKITHDEIQGRVMCWLYEPGRVYRASKEQGDLGSSLPQFEASSFSWDEEYGGENGVPIKELEDIVPVVPYRNEEGVGEFARHIPILDRIDHLVLQGMVVATYQAFKQRGIKANPDDMPRYDPDTNEEIDYDDIFAADPGALWRLPESAEMWESGAVDITPIWTGIDRDIQKLSAVTFTPLAMFSPEGQNQTAEGATFAREGRTYKIEDRQELFGRSHEKALSMLLRISGEPERSEVGRIKITWKPAERHSLAAKSSAMSQTRGDIPFKVRAQQIWQASPAEAEEMERLREQEMLMLAAMDFEADLAPKESSNTSAPYTELSTEERRESRELSSKSARGLSEDG